MTTMHKWNFLLLLLLLASRVSHLFAFVQQVTLSHYLPTRTRVLLSSATFGNLDADANTTATTAAANTPRYFQRTRRPPKFHPGESNRLVERRQWLQDATNALLNTPVGSLVKKGKWHELFSMLSAWSRHVKNDAEAPIVMERIVQRLLLEERQQQKDQMVTIDAYNMILDAWACAALFKTHSPPQVASQRAREILVLLQETFEKQQQQQQQQQQEEDLSFSSSSTISFPTIMPNEKSFEFVMHVVSKVEGAIYARRVLAWTEYLYKTGRNPLARPTPHMYFVVLEAYTRHPNHNAGALAEGFLRHMRARAVDGVRTDTLCYNMVIKAWTKSTTTIHTNHHHHHNHHHSHHHHHNHNNNHTTAIYRGRENAEHADRILEEMIKDPTGPKPDIVTYASVISAWANSGMRAHAVSRAEELLREIEDNPALELNTVVLNSVMLTWIKSRNPAAVQRTAELLRNMEESPLDSTIRPDLISYNNHIHALAMHSSKSSEYAQRAMDVLCRWEQRFDTGEMHFGPNLFTYNLVIDAWSKCRDYDGAAYKAGHVLRKLVKRPSIEPDAFSFNQVLSALSRCTLPGAARRAEELLEYMEDAYQSGLHPHAMPDVIGYTSVIVAYSRSGEPGSALRAERLLQRLKQRYAATGQRNWKPNRICYNSLIDAWAKSGEGTLGARKAEALLVEMEQLYEAGDDYMAPDIVTYNALLNCWARSGTRCCGRKAETYLNRIWERYQAGDAKVQPNAQTFNTVINAISKSKSEAKAQRALRILRRMDKLYRAGNKEARPSSLTYTAVLNSCAFPAVSDERTRRKALDTAIFTLEELQSSRYGHPNHITWGTFIKACHNLLRDDEATRRVVIQKAFQQCCQDGQVGEMVLEHLRDAVPADLFEELLLLGKRNTGRSVWSITVDDLPMEWRCNVRESKKKWSRKSKTSSSADYHKSKAATSTRNRDAPSFNKDRPSKPDEIRP